VSREPRAAIVLRDPPPDAPEPAGPGHPPAQAPRLPRL